MNERDTAALLTDICQILDVVKLEWGDEWSDWDQSVRDRITDWLKGYYYPPPCDPCKPGGSLKLDDPFRND